MEAASDKRVGACATMGVAVRQLVDDGDVKPDSKGRVDLTYYIKPTVDVPRQLQFPVVLHNGCTENLSYMDDTASVPGGTKVVYEVTPRAMHLNDDDTCTYKPIPGVVSAFFEDPRAAVLHVVKNSTCDGKSTAREKAISVTSLDTATFCTTTRPLTDAKKKKKKLGAPSVEEISLRRLTAYGRFVTEKRAEGAEDVSYNAFSTSDSGSGSTTTTTKAARTPKTATSRDASYTPVVMCDLAKLLKMASLNRTDPGSLYLAPTIDPEQLEVLLGENVDDDEDPMEEDDDPMEEEDGDGDEDETERPPREAGTKRPRGGSETESTFQPGKKKMRKKKISAAADGDEEEQQQQVMDTMAAVEISIIEEKKEDAALDAGVEDSGQLDMVIGEDVDPMLMDGAFVVADRDHTTVYLSESPIDRVDQMEQDRATVNGLQDSDPSQDVNAQLVCVLKKEQEKSRVEMDVLRRQVGLMESRIRSLNDANVKRSQEQTDAIVVLTNTMADSMRQFSEELATVFTRTNDMYAQLQTVQQLQQHYQQQQQQVEVLGEGSSGWSLTQDLIQQTAKSIGQTEGMPQTMVGTVQCHIGQAFAPYGELSHTMSPNDTAILARSKTGSGEGSLLDVDMLSFDLIS